MNKLLAVHVFQTNTEVNENAPDQIFAKIFYLWLTYRRFLIFFDESTEVSIGTILNDDIYLRLTQLFIDEGVIIAYDVW